ncbi:cytochrome b5-related protein-like [Rhynchophorus ferrugineus]|uniref:Cytochrome b5-related protein n=1 Tax=Rhynchophorus ferrugineus TaxID=354439 RepID=A0A834MFV1_RHYFE|nr:hypothetical protein GWI33_005718 [Rhynchophorus ferrugineus]
MAPNADSMPPSTLKMKPPARRQKLHTVDMWLEDKREIDGAEGLWRVGDKLYDLTDFIKRHPGGPEWLELSKGLDITEAFEVHHVRSNPEEILKKYYVRDARIPRNAPFTFKEDGFYKTLKREVAKVLPTLPKQSIRTTNFFIDSFFCIFIFLSILAVTYWNFILGILAGNFLAILAIAAHNYFHQKDNYRMYYFNLSLMQVREWRISHILSHHLHTNTIDDLEISAWQPFLQYLPIKEKPLRRYGQWLAAPIIWVTGFHRSYITRVLEYISGRGYMGKGDLIPFIVPLAMYIFGGQALVSTLIMWTFIVCVGSTHFFFVGLHAAHHHPDIFHDGDTPRSESDYDWGLSQMDAVMDRKEITGSHFLVLTNFGDHALHHLFPTLDHGTLELLYPTFEKVMTQFDTNLRMVSQLDTIYGGFQQLVRVQPSTCAPDLKKYKYERKL